LEQQELARTLGIDDSITILPFLSREALAAVYRRADVVLQPSESEGFGLPVAEALACGTPVVASDIPVLREAGGDAALYAPVGATADWCQRVIDIIDERVHRPEASARRRERGMRHAALFSWPNYAASMADAYRRVGGRA